MPSLPGAPPAPMRAVVQRVREAAVTVDGETVGAIGPGLAVLIGVTHDDSPDDAAFIARKIVAMRIFEDDAGKMNRGLLDTGGEMLLVSQFTLYADTRKGRRPAFTGAAPPDKAEELLQEVVRLIRERGVTVAEGRFGAHMQVALVNDGPVTILLDSAEAR